MEARLGAEVAGECVAGALQEQHGYPDPVQVLGAADTRPLGRMKREAQEDQEELEKPGAPWTVPSGILAMVLGCVLVYGCMFATGNWIYGNYALAGGLTALVVVAAYLLNKVWNKIKGDVL